MNKTFKVIWNHATQSWVAVSELSKVKGKTKSTSLSKAIAIAALVTSPVYAANVIQGDGATASTQGIALGDNAKATGNQSPIAIGVNAEATNQNDIAIGNKAGFGFNDKGSNFNGSGKHSFVGQGTFTTNTAETISTHSNLAIGINAGTNATGIRNIAIGENAATQHFGEESITIGYGANNFSGDRKNTDGTSLTAGDTYRARRTIAIGKEAMTYGEDSIAIGYGANTKQTAYNSGANYTNASNAVALGRGATASGDSSFAQGYFASAQGQGDIAIGIAARTLLDPSLPNNARNFRIAIGRDAKVGEGALNNSLAIGSSAKVLAGNNAVALGAFTQAIGNNLNVALGSSSRTWGDRPNAIGNSNTAGGFDSSAIGAQSHVLMRYGTNGGTSNNGVAVGAGTVSGNSNAVALGNAVAVFGLNSGALSASSKNPIAENSLKLGDTTKLGNADNTASPITIIGGDENFAIGNNNVIGSSSNNNMVMGNRIAVGATGATTNGLINIYRLAIKDSATGQVSAPATAYIKEGSGNSAKYYAFDRDAADYKGAQLDLTGKKVEDEVQFVHIVPTFNNTKSINRSIAIGQSASVNDNDTIAIGTNATAGDSSKAANATINAIAIGNNTKATESQTIAMGTNANATASQAIAIGDTSKASGNSSVALGPSTNSTGVSSTALGNGSQSTKNDATAVGAYAKALGESSVALGHDANVSAAQGIAIGQESKVSGTKSVAIGIENNVSGKNTFVLGNSVTAATSGSVVLGDMASTEGSHAIANVTNATVNGIYYGDFVGKVKDNGRFVSVGAKGDERKLINVAAGNISATSTEAINGSQLYLVTNTLRDQMPVVYTTADGTKVTKQGDKFYKVNPDGSLGEEVPASDIIASMNSGDNSTTTPTTLTNVAGNLQGAKEGTTAPTISATAPTTEEVANISNNAATVGDVLNAGWNLQENSAAKDFVKPYDTVNFVNGTGTIVNVTTTKDGTKSDITFNVDTGSITLAGEQDVTDDNGNVVTPAGQVSVSGDQANKIATVQNVADAINSAGWMVNTGKADDQNSFDTTKQDHVAKKVSAGNQVNFKAGKNMEVKRDGNDIIYATSNDVSFDTVTVGNTKISNDGVRITGGPSMTTNGIDAGSQRITNVKAGVDDNDAVNVSQLKEVKADVANNTAAIANNTVAIANNTAAIANNTAAIDKNTQNITNLTNNVNTLANNTIKLGGNTGVTNPQALNKKDGLQFNIKGENGLTTTAAGTDITVTITQSNLTPNSNGTVSAGTSGNAYATAEQVANAINSVGWFTNVSKATGKNAEFFETNDSKERKVSAGDKVIFQAGKNIEVKQDGDNIIYTTSENVTFNTVQIGGDNGPKISADGDNIKIGDKDGKPTKITNVANGTSANDAVNLSQLNATKTTVVGVGAVNVTSTSDANGTVYTVRADVDNTTIKIDAEGKIAANTGTITAAPSNITDASGNVLPNAGVVTVVAGEGNRVATVQNVADAINSAGWIVNTGKADDQNSFDTKAQNHVAKKVAAGNQVNFKAGKNMEVKRDGNDIIYATSNDVSFNTVTVGNTKISNDGVRITGGPSMTTNGIDAGSKRITNVAPGVADTDAVNVSQLKGATANINNQLNKMDKRRKAGHASGLAAAGLMQAYREGQSAVTAGVAQYQNESAVAVGYSRIADSGKYGVKASFSANTQGEVGGAVSAGYFW